MGLVIFSTNELLALLREKLRIHLQHTCIIFRLDLKQVYIKARVNGRSLSKMPKSRQAKQTADCRARCQWEFIFFISFKSRFSPSVTGDIIGTGKPSQPWIAKQDANVSFLHCFRVVSGPVHTSCKPLQCAQAQQLSWQSSCLIIKRLWVRILHKLSQSESRIAQQDANDYLRSRQAKQTVDCRARCRCVFFTLFPSCFRPCAHQ